MITIWRRNSANILRRLCHNVQKINFSVDIARESVPFRIDRKELMAVLSKFRTKMREKAGGQQIELKECKLCHKGNKSNADNIWKLTVWENGGYNCMRCSKGGNWYDLKRKSNSVGDPGKDHGVRGSSRSGNRPQYPISAHQSLAKVQPLEKTNATSPAAPSVSYVIPNQTLMLKMYHNLFPSPTANHNSDSRTDHATNTTASQPHPHRSKVMQYLNEQRGLEDAVLRRYGVGYSIQQFLNEQNEWTDHVCVTFPWMLEAAHVHRHNVTFTNTNDNAPARQPRANSHYIVRTKYRSLETKGLQRILPKGGMRGLFGWQLVTGGRGNPNNCAISSSSNTMDTSSIENVGKNSMDDKAARTGISSAGHAYDPTGKIIAAPATTTTTTTIPGPTAAKSEAAVAMAGPVAYPPSKSIILTEGEYDAMAVSQALSRLPINDPLARIPAVSLPNGCNSLPSELVALLQPFDQIYLWMDFDKSGQDASDKFAQKLGVKRCLIVKPDPDDEDPPKDANDALRRDLLVAQRKASHPTTLEDTDNGSGGQTRDDDTYNSHPASSSIDPSSVPTTASSSSSSSSSSFPLILKLLRAAQSPTDEHIQSFRQLRQHVLTGLVVSARLREVQQRRADRAEKKKMRKKKKKSKGQQMERGELGDQIVVQEEEEEEEEEGAEEEEDALDAELEAQLLQQLQMESGTPVPSLPALNAICKGFRRGEFIVFTGPTGSGKTTLLSQLSVDFAQQGKPTLWGSFEVRNARLMSKLLQQSHKMGPLQCLSADKLQQVASDFEALPLQLLNFHGATEVDRIMAAMDAAVYKDDIQHIIIDNLQFLLPRAAARNAFEKFEFQDSVIERFRHFATEKNVNIILVIHPRKEDETSLLSISSIFGSAKASQEADLVMILQNALPSTGSGGLTNTHIHRTLEVKKNRYDGHTGSVPLQFNPQTLCYEVREAVATDPAKPVVDTSNEPQQLHFTTGASSRRGGKGEATLGGINSSGTSSSSGYVAANRVGAAARAQQQHRPLLNMRSRFARDDDDNQDDR
eukprot:CAMPEP_0174961352 /NCGR_PEP_ID=MMETSP0004_2-20121128/4192_1 /TAXON_ID=420556 /ORGANISM="Ochromonas sp., Strain CCMP1393" /LENGTH=1031 /DNA_ID=CAMNT_0016209787 /DNA_START=137 /DNA_END=3232 /DNA_ORIENTATION=+